VNPLRAFVTKPGVRLAGALALAGLLALSAPVRAQVDTLKVMIGANPGGGFDQTGRSLGAAMIAAGSARNATFENKGGAGGTIGLAQFVNSERGNGSALIVTGAVMVGAIETGKPPVTLKNATPIARLFADTMILVVPANSPLQTLKDLIDKLKANPGSVSWGGGSRGSIDHIMVGLIAKEVGVDPTKVNYVAFAGGGEAKSAILGGHVTVGVAGVSEFAPDVDAGRMRALGISSSFKLRNLPTLKEQGVNVEIYNWRGVYGAPGITAEQRKTLTDAVVKGTEHASWKEALRKNDWGPFLLTGDDFGKYVEAESARLGGILREIGVAK
jgi:putative tricarboxylic transport membrane protein